MSTITVEANKKFPDQIERASRMAEAFVQSAKIRFEASLEEASGKENQLFDTSEFLNRSSVTAVTNNFNEQAFDRILNLKFLDRG